MNIGLAIHAWDTFGRRRTVSEDQVARAGGRLREETDEHAVPEPAEAS